MVSKIYTHKKMQTANGSSSDCRCKDNERTTAKSSPEALRERLLQTVSSSHLLSLSS